MANTQEDKDFEQEVKDTLENPTLEGLAYLISNMIYLIEGSLQHNISQAAILNTIVDVLEDKQIIDSEKFKQDLDKNIKLISDNFNETSKQIEEEIQKASEVADAQTENVPESPKE